MSPERTQTNDSYPLKVWFDSEDDVYIAEFLDLPGCFAPGATVEEAYQRAQKAKKDWIRIAMEQGLPIPPPSRTGEHSGRILLRLPSALHGILADRAKDQSTSLNQYAVYLLSGAVIGDIVSNQMDQLETRIASLESQVARLAREVQFSNSEITRQLVGMSQLGSSNPIQRTAGGPYEAVGGIISASPRIH